MTAAQEPPTATTDLPRRRLARGLSWVKGQIQKAWVFFSSAQNRRRERAALSRRLHTHYWWIVFVIVVMGMGEQALLYTRADPMANGGSINIFPARFVLPGIMLYVAVTLKILRSRTATALNQLRPVVRIDAQTFDAHVQRTLWLNRWHLFLLLCLNVVFDLYVYGVQKAPLQLGMMQTLPPDWPAAPFVMGTLILFGWLIVTLIYACAHFALSLNRLSRYNLVVNVLDPYGLLPFGELALLYSLTLVVFLLLLLVPLGWPEDFPDYIGVLIASLGSLWALIGPIWGVHRQIQKAKHEMLEKIHEQFHEIQGIILDGTRFEKGELDDLSDRAEKLVKLRSLVWEAPNWPFRTSTGVLRAMLAALTPLLLVILQVIVQNITAYWIARTGGP